jgi:hypothetical protein
MGNETEKLRPAPKKLVSELDRSRDDLAEGRVSAIGPVLTSIHARATRRIERRHKARQAEGEKLAEPG